MANEAVCYEKPTRFARYTCADGIGIAKGAVLALTSPNTASACAADNDVAAGIAWMEKVASDGTTEVTAALDGTWGLVMSTAATITVGQDVVIKGSNVIGPYTSLDDEKGYVLGKSLATYGTSAANTVVVRLNV